MDRITSVMHYLQDQIHRPVSMEQMAEVAHVSPVQLYRIFKKTTGLTPVQFHEHLRIKESLTLLQQTGRVLDVAFELGYENYETFSRAFKKIVSVTPSDVLWAMSFMEHKHPEEFYVLVKQDASVQAIHKFLKEEETAVPDSSQPTIYRMTPKPKGRPEIIRCKRSEELLRPYYP